MVEWWSLLIGIVVLALGIPIGNWLAKITKEELRQAQLWFRLIILVALIGSIFSLIFRNDVLLFSFLFLAIVTSRSLRYRKKGKKRKKAK